MVRIAMGWKRASASLLLVFLLTVGLLPQDAFAAKGDKEFKAGREAEIRKDYDTALTKYEEALKLNPSNPQFVMATSRARFQAGVAHVDRGHKYLGQGNLKDAMTEFEQAAALDPSNATARQEIARTRLLIQQQNAPATLPQSQQPPVTPPTAAPPGGAAPPSSGIGNPRLEDALGPAELKPLSQAPINLKMRNESKMIFETIGKLAGINVLFDPDFVSKPITVELNGVSLEEALDQTALLTKTFWKVLTSNTILVVPDTAVKRREQEEQIIRTFYLSNPITPQELTEAVTAIRSLLETRRIQQINSLNAIIIRDTPDRVAIAEKIIQDIDKAKSEVVVDVAVLEVRRDKTRQLGLYPVSGGAPGIQVQSAFTPRGATTSSSSSTDPNTGIQTTTGTTTGSIPLNRLGTLSTGDFSITLPGAALTALLSDSNTRVLQRPEVRASDGQKATLRIGDRVPVATGSFQPGIGGVGVNPLVNTQFQYLDVGVNLDITPKVHINGEVTLKVRVEVSQVTSKTNIGGIDQPIIGQRIIDHDIRLREGEINILGGLMQTQLTKSVTGVPGLSQIPLLKYLFSNTSSTLAEDEVLIVLTPHAVRLPEILPLNRRSLDVGTEGDVRLRSRRSLPQAVPAPAALPPAPGAAPVPPAATGAGQRPASIPPVSVSPSIAIENTSLVQKPGDTFEVPVRVQSSGEVNSASFEISYDPTLMKLVRVKNGGFLGTDGEPVAVVQRTDEQSGKTVVTLTRPPASAGVKGEGTLAVLTFEAGQPGTTALGVTPAGSSAEFLFARVSQATVTIK
ncbi:MAG: hypothetical protein HYX72_06005 [Acidobacteria bacterium]|nr:hypothetical protein [Acidobacteriota bacterium]